MTSKTFSFNQFYSETLLLGILFVFFFELLSDIISSIFALNLLTASLNGYVLIILFLLLPVILVFFRKAQSEWLLFITGLLIILCRVLEPLFAIPPVKAIFSGIGVASFLVFLIIFIWRKAHYSIIDQSALSLGAGFTFSIGMLVLLRTIGSSIDISLFNWGQIIGWFLGIVALFLLSLRLFKKEETFVTEGLETSFKTTEENGQLDSSNNAPSKRLFWKVLGLVLNIIGIISLAFYIFSSPGILSRWVGSNYLAIVFIIAGGVGAFFIILIVKPSLISRIKNWLLWLLNVSFALSLTVTLLANQPRWLVLRQVFLYLMLLLSPVIFLDFLLLCKELLTMKPTLRKLGGSFTISIFVLILTIFGIIFTIAYDYIPIVGPFFRNKHWFVMMVVVIMGCIPTAFMKKKRFKIQGKLFKSKPEKKFLVSIISLLFIGTLVSGIATLPFPQEQPLGKTTIKVVTFNVQQGFDIEGNLNFSGILADLRKIDADIIGLQESDTCRVSSGNNDLVRFLASKLHLYSFFGPLTVTGTFGIALLSKYPILSARTYFMYSEGEQTATIEAQITIQGRTFNVFVTHFGEKEFDKQQQAETIVLLTAGKSDVIVLGDFNFEPWSSQYNTTTAQLKDAWLAVWPTGVDDTGYNGSTFNWRNPYTHIDFIFVSPFMVLTDCRVIRDAHSSDHMPVTATIQL
ncbi:MAG: endonuclease/exonuclease/phosphatase family protein [Candidatus Heimdallarchaeota archaeon]|nr:endonuclease/exonuclease/phosphatase family protein [Candidatus Heimdallarchaeota archaeon]